MINLKKSKEQRKRENKPVELSSEQYPYGFRLNFHRPELKKLGIDISKLDLKAKVNIKAVGEIVSVSENKTPNMEDEYSQCLEIQITDIELDIPKSKFAKYKENKNSLGGMA